MAELTTKAEALAQIQAGRGALYDTVRALDSERLGQPGVHGLWSVKDIVMHVVAWEAMALTWLDQAARGESLTLPDWRNVDALNDELYRQHRDLPWDRGFGYLNDQPFDDLALADRWAAQTTGGDATFAEVRALYRTDDNLRVPAEWLNER